MRPKTELEKQDNKPTDVKSVLEEAQEDGQ